MQCVSCHKVMSVRLFSLQLYVSHSHHHLSKYVQPLILYFSVCLSTCYGHLSIFLSFLVSMSYNFFGTNLIPKIQNGLFSPNRYKNAIFQAKIYCKIINCFYKWPIFWLMIGQKKRFSRFRPKKFCNIVQTDNPRLNPAEVDEFSMQSFKKFVGTSFNTCRDDQV